MITMRTDTHGKCNWCEFCPGPYLHMSGLEAIECGPDVLPMCYYAI